MSRNITRLDYCQYLLVSQVNYTLTNFADHSDNLSHDEVNRYLKRERITPRLIWENVHAQVDADEYGYLLFDDTVLDKRHSFAIELVRCIDQAAFHTTDKVKVPEGIHLLFLPPKSPELQPAERLWPIANEAIANESFANLDELEDTMVQRCQVLMKRQDFVRGLTGFYWWLEAVA